MGGDALFGYDGVFYTLFLLTPPRGGRRFAVVQLSCRSIDFYSRPRMGGDLRWQDVNHYAVFISTHAPA